MLRFAKVQKAEFTQVELENSHLEIVTASPSLTWLEVSSCSLEKVWPEVLTACVASLTSLSISPRATNPLSSPQVWIPLVKYPQRPIFDKHSGRSSSSSSDYQSITAIWRSWACHSPPWRKFHLGSLRLPLAVSVELGWEGTDSPSHRCSGVPDKS